MTLPASGAVKIEKTPFKGWPNCYRITNGEVELIVTSDIGPRIMRYGFVGGQNLFKEFEATLGKSGEAEWQLRGGHRIWVGPEDVTYTYAPDNGPVKIEVRGDVLVATQPTEPLTGLEKQLEIKLAPTGSAVEVIHRIRNANSMPVEFAAWALTMMAPTGTGITGFPPRGTHPENLEPANPLVMWRFSDLSDPRWKFTNKYLILKQDPKNKRPQKLGHWNRHTWGAYLLGSDLFIKRYEASEEAYHPDMGCSYETFTNDQFLEMETMGPLRKVVAGQSLEHVEHWTLHKGVKIAAWTDDAIDAALLPLLK
ncbi:MAG: hypothetical protein ABI693_13280 [Bryobacteraceae bacterium]